MRSRSPIPIDPNDPRAPSEAVWAGLSEDERARLVEELPSEVPWELSPPGPSPQTQGARRRRARHLFSQHRAQRLRLLGSRGLLPGGAPVRSREDLLAVLDVPTHDRDKWVVSAEGKGLDFVLEVLYHGDAVKDLQDNVVRFARLGIHEYFVYDRGRGRLHGYALPAGGRAYQPIVPQSGRWASRVLGLSLALEVDRVRFYVGSAPIPELAEIAQRTEALLSDAMARRDEIEVLLAHERARAEQAQKDAELAQKDTELAQKDAEQARREAAELRARLERLERERKSEP